ncbi:DNA mismatch repair protein [Binucleata daphniae]
MQNGTIVSINDIFYNNKIRKKYFYKRKEEITRIYYLIANYSIYNAKIRFMLYKDDKMLNVCNGIQNKADIEHKKQLIRSIYNINSKLCEYADDCLLLLHTNINQHTNTFFFILFVNNRIVENKTLKDKIKSLYIPHIPKNKYPFVYIELTIETENVDVNVHPEKKEVLFMNEEQIYQKITSKIEENMQEQIEIEEKNNQKQKQNDFDSNIGTQRQIIYTNPENSSIVDIFDKQNSQIEVNETQKIYSLESIRKLKEKLIKVDDFYPEKLVFIGQYDNNIVMQYNTLLLLCDSDVLVRSYFYQRLLLDFGNFRSKKINKKQNETFTQNHISILSLYFMITIENRVVTQIPVIGKTSIKDDDLDEFFHFFAKIELQNEEDVFNKLFNKLTTLFVSNYVNDESNFNLLKRSIVITNELKSEFKILTSLSELYKLFERC